MQVTQETTSHILQCPQPESQSLWDGAILHLREQLLQADTDPDIIEDLSTSLEAWITLPPRAITNVGHPQFELT